MRTIHTDEMVRMMGVHDGDVEWSLCGMCSGVGVCARLRLEPAERSESDDPARSAYRACVGG